MENHHDLCNTNLSLGIGSANPSPNQTEKNDVVSNHDEGEGSRKKLHFSNEQSLILEESFKEFNVPNTAQTDNLATALNLTRRQVEVWFRNRRVRSQRNLTRRDCERWEKGCAELTKENKKLEKELAELQALKRMKERASLISAPAENDPAAWDFYRRINESGGGIGGGDGGAGSSSMAADDDSG